MTKYPEHLLYKPSENMLKLRRELGRLCPECKFHTKLKFYKCDECGREVCSSCLFAKVKEVKLRHERWLCRTCHEKMRMNILFSKDEERQCEWCGRMMTNVKLVQILQWRNDPNHGLRDICGRCRKGLKGLIRIVRDGKIQLNGKIIPVIPEEKKE